MLCKNRNIFSSLSFESSISVHCRIRYVVLKKKKKLKLENQLKENIEILFWHE